MPSARRFACWSHRIASVIETPERNGRARRMTSAEMGRGSRLMFFANLLMVGLGSFFVVSLLLEVSRPRGLPPFSGSQQRVRAGLLGELASPARVIEQLENWNVIVSKNLFNESRKERAA